MPSFPSVLSHPSAIRHQLSLHLFSEHLSIFTASSNPPFCRRRCRSRRCCRRRRRTKNPFSIDPHLHNLAENMSYFHRFYSRKSILRWVFADFSLVSVCASYFYGRAVYNPRRIRLYFCCYLIRDYISFKVRI